MNQKELRHLWWFLNEKNSYFGIYIFQSFLKKGKCWKHKQGCYYNKLTNIFLSLLLISEIEEDVVSLLQFSTELIVEAAATCLQIINNEVDIPHKLPPSMSARFRVGTKLATVIQVSFLWY